MDGKTHTPWVREFANVREAYKVLGSTHTACGNEVIVDVVVVVVVVASRSKNSGQSVQQHAVDVLRSCLEGRKTPRVNSLYSWGTAYSEHSVNAFRLEKAHPFDLQVFENMFVFAIQLLLTRV